MTRFAFEPIYGSLLFALVCAVIVVAVIGLVTPPTQVREHRKWLILLRSVAALVLLLAALRPSLIRTDNRPAEATLIVAADVSRSMTLPDGDGNDRWSTQSNAWRQLSNGIAGLDDALDVQLLVYDRDARVLPNPSPDALEALSPDGNLTDLSVAAAQSIQAAAGKPIAGVVFMGDGAQTAPLGDTARRTPGNSGAQRSVETLNALGVPFWPIPIGPAAGAEASRDASIDALSESFQLFAGNEFDVSFQLSSRGLSGIELPVRLTWIRSDGSTFQAAERSFVSQKAADTAGFNLSLVAPAPGTYRLQAEVAKQSGELVTANNSQTAFVDVREGGGRILYLEGDHRQEQTFLTRALRRFPDLDLTFKSLRSDRQWPIDLGNWFAKGKFDVYILGDVDTDALGTKQLAALTERIADGAGLVMLGGYHTFDSGGYATSPLRDAIPIRMNPALRRTPGNTLEPQYGQIPGPIVIEIAKRHPITDLGGDDPNQIWKELPPQKGCNRFLGPKVAAGVEVLLQTPDKLPLLITGEFGRARTAAIAFDSTWQWWRAGKSETHRRFWRQIMLWLLSRDETGGDKIIVEMDSRRFNIEDSPEFSARIETLDDQPILLGLVAEIVDVNGVVKKVTTTNVMTNSDRTTAIKGTVPNLEQGFYTLRISPADSNSKIQPAELAFQTIDASREMSRPMADPVYLRQLASLTADHGGAAFGPDEIDELVQTIADRRRQAETPVVEKNRLGDGPLSGWIVFVIFGATLTVEWFLRRKWGMA